jgi:hypothetical protein
MELNTGDCCSPLWKKCPPEFALLLGTEPEVCPTLEGIAAAESEPTQYGEEYICRLSITSILSEELCTFGN